MEFPKAYDPKAVEEKMYQLWEKSGFFNPDNLPSDGEPYTIVMPPPNITGTLHVGHALELTIQDILIRYQRMRGRKTLWLPGVDHAAIATQSKMEELLYKKEGTTRHDVGREEFLKRTSVFTRENHHTIVNQIRRMGASVDWSREAFTLDEKRSRAVHTAFKTMYDDGLIYRGARIVNWDPKLQTTVSDDEIRWVEEKTPLYYLKYGPFTIATARPETKFGDKYVVVHPDDERYVQYHDTQQLAVEWINGSITATIIKDASIDMKFGTGVMTITPWHDAADFEIAEQRHLDKEQIIDFQGKLLPIAGEFTGVHIKKARPLIVEKLKAHGLLEKVDEMYIHRIATNSRGGGIIEPQIKEQWFVAVNKEFSLPNKKTATLKSLMRLAVESGHVSIIPDRFVKTYFYWIDNLRDWCISRQIWYGHRIPVWYRASETYCGILPPAGDGWEQDPDTLDTWFSSGLWTFSTLGWPDNTEDLRKFHPTDVLGPGYDILFFWVARMIAMSMYLLGDIPFRAVYLHGLVRDKDRQKMSKSKGNVIDPLGVIDVYGADALRFALVFSTAAGNDVPLSEDTIRGMKHFTNKIWNIARFILVTTEREQFENQNQPQPITEADTAVCAKLAETRGKICAALDTFELHEAAQAIYQCIWHWFADVYIEEAKIQLKDVKQKENTQKILAHCLPRILKLLHPFMPFITEEVWQRIYEGKKKILMVEPWE